MKELILIIFLVGLIITMFKIFNIINNFKESTMQISMFTFICLLTSYLINMPLYILNYATPFYSVIFRIHQLMLLLGFILSVTELLYYISNKPNDREMYKRN